MSAIQDRGEAASSALAGLRTGAGPRGRCAAGPRHGAAFGKAGR